MHRNRNLCRPPVRLPRSDHSVANVVVGVCKDRVWVWVVGVGGVVVGVVFWNKNVVSVCVRVVSEGTYRMIAVRELGDFQVFFRIWDARVYRTPKHDTGRTAPGGHLTPWEHIF